MSNAIVSRLGQVDKQGDVRALFLKTFAGEVITAFETSTILKPLHRQRTISEGKSASFPMVYKAATQYHQPGELILGGTIAHNEVVIPIDDLLISPVFIANIDEAMNHYEVRSTYSNEMGLALGLAYDKNVARNLVRASRGPAHFAGDVGGQTVVDANAKTVATALAGSIWEAKQALEEADVPVDSVQVNAVLRPTQWYMLAQEPTLILNKDVGGDGSYSRGRFELIGGVMVHKSNALPWGTDDSENTELPSAYRVDMTNTAGVVFTEAAAATVQLMGMSLESEYQINRQGTLMVGRYAVGHGPLVNKCAVEIATA
ncbi:MAG: major capsid protein [Lysobacteraceae bacterium]